MHAWQGQQQAGSDIYIKQHLSKRIFLYERHASWRGRCSAGCWSMKLVKLSSSSILGGLHLAHGQSEGRQAWLRDTCPSPTTLPPLSLREAAHKRARGRDWEAGVAGQK